MQKILFAIILLAADQFLKYCAKNGLLSFLGGFFDKTICNPNISWGIELNIWLFAFFWLFFITILLFLLKKKEWDIFLVIILTGAFSNMLDRLFFGCVTDFISISSFPVFNFADVLITGGIVLFLAKGIVNKEL